MRACQHLVLMQLHLCCVASYLKSDVHGSSNDESITSHAWQGMTGMIAAQTLIILPVFLDGGAFCSLKHRCAKGLLHIYARGDNHHPCARSWCRTQQLCCGRPRNGHSRSFWNMPRAWILVCCMISSPCSVRHAPRMPPCPFI